MKNYYTQQKELEISNLRLETLNLKLKILESKVTRCTSELRDVSYFGSGNSSDKYLQYIIDKTEIEKEIEFEKQENDILKQNLKAMEKVLEQIQGIEEKIFVSIYVKNLKPTETARRIPCDLSTVYRYLKKIEVMIEDAKK